MPRYPTVPLEDWKEKAARTSSPSTTRFTIHSMWFAPPCGRTHLRSRFSPGIVVKQAVEALRHCAACRLSRSAYPSLPHDALVSSFLSGEQCPDSVLD